MSSFCQYDFSRLTEKLSGLNGALMGSGADGGDLQRMLDVETGQLAGRIGDAVGPATQAKALKKVDSDLKKYLTVLPDYSNLDEDQQYSSTADFTWLYAAPATLVGINDEDNQISASGADALEMFRGSQKAGLRGAAYVSLGARGKQHVKRLNRTRVSTAAYNYVRATIKNKTGELRAAFYRVAIQFAPNKRVPQWIAGKVPQVIESGKSTLADVARGTPDAYIEFGVRAPGVTSNGAITAKITGAIRQTSYIVESKLKKLLAGYKYNWETGQIFKPKAAHEFEDN